MSCSLLRASWFFLLLILLVAASFGHVLFLRFCKRVAALQGREREYESDKGSDDVGTNSFVREQSKRLNRGDFAGIEDPDLLALGWRVRRRNAAQVVILILLIAAGLWMQSGGCFG